MAHDPTQKAEWLEPPEEELGLKRYVETIRERIGLIVVAVLVTTAAAVAYVLTAPKTYEAEADLLVAPVSSETLPSLPLIRQSPDPTRDVETAARLVTNNDVAERVRSDLGIDEDAQDLLKKVSAEPVAQSNIVAVTAEERSPAEARDLANAFSEAAVTEQTEQLHEEIDAQIAGLQEGQTSLGGRLAELQALRNGPDPTLRLETAADLPQNQASPRPALTVAGGLIAGLVIGIAGAFAAQILDPRLRREDQLRRRYRLPILARVPRDQGKRDQPLTPRQVSSPTAEAYRTLRTTLERPTADRIGSRAILITGPSPSEGKTTTALNLATSLALAGRRVILIEADLRRPALASALGIEEARPGVVSVLIENVALQDALIASPTYGPNLQVLAADFSGGWIAELFSIPAAQGLIDDARALADFVIVDSPPLTEVVDALPLARKCDDVLIVTRLGKTRLDRIARLGELLADNGIAPVGFAVIGVPPPGRSEYRYYMEAPEAQGDGGGRLFEGAGRT
ncbi:MAG: Wzz/FepE/Etk N-terminal domain-containing protein [Solirubrobacterales bacterium]